MTGRRRGVDVPSDTAGGSGSGAENLATEDSVETSPQRLGKSSLVSGGDKRLSFKRGNEREVDSSCQIQLTLLKIYSFFVFNVSNLCSVVIQYFYRFYSIKTYYKTEAVIPCAVSISLLPVVKVCFPGEQTQWETSWRRRGFLGKS